MALGVWNCWFLATSVTSRLYHFSNQNSELFRTFLSSGTERLPDVGICGQYALVHFNSYPNTRTHTNSFTKHTQIFIYPKIQGHIHLLKNTNEYSFNQQYIQITIYPQNTHKYSFTQQYTQLFIHLTMHTIIHLPKNAIWSQGWTWSPQSRLTKFMLVNIYLEISTNNVFDLHFS